jgi:hypothetical protein
VGHDQRSPQERGAHCREHRREAHPHSWFPRLSSRFSAAPNAYAPTTQVSVSASAWQSSKASPEHTTEPSPSPPGGRWRAPRHGATTRCATAHWPRTEEQPARHESTLARRDGWILYGAQRSQPLANDRGVKGSKARLKRPESLATGCQRLPPRRHGKECHEEGPPRVTGSGLSSASYREQARLHVVRRSGSQSQAPRFPSARR